MSEKENLANTPLAEVNDIVSYIVDNEELPLGVRTLRSNMEEKLKAVISAITLQNLVRAMNLNNILIKLEGEHFSETAIAAMTNEERAAEIANVSKIVMSNLEFTRKFAVQNKDFFAQNSSEAEDLVKELAKLPAEKIVALRKAIESGALDDVMSPPTEAEKGGGDTTPID